MNKIEIWKDIPWFEWLYQVSTLWNIKSLEHKKKISEWVKNYQETIKTKV